MSPTALHAVLILGVVAGAAACGAVYIGDPPTWYLSCTGDTTLCTCPVQYDELSLFTTQPQVPECSATAVGGLCCADPNLTGQECSCVGIVCADTGSSCTCTIMPNIDQIGGNGVAACPSYGQCCLKPGSTACTCSSAPCGPDETPSPGGCDPSVFTCGFLQQDSQLGSTFGGSATDACSRGPVTVGPDWSGETCAGGGQSCSKDSDCCSDVCISTTQTCT